ncbi:hypothetical protein B5X24_HaOG210343 [Helicoverpa armigera]|uniref:Uncharacterized protein n=1 Tax=Helicoverpa armigera TaxID=29058 RepID=A0A2W1BJD6_HELAM|nr:hypothetical protein B5X24_HaOG210343 [Helicoverpa armigera]
MELHLHLSVAFRSLDRKWGTPVDLDTAEDLSRCLPAVVDMPTATFSSEEFLRSRRRQKPYSRHEHRRSKERGEVNDSFSNISCSRIPSVSDLEEVTSSRGSCLSIKTEFSTDLDRSIMEYLGDCDKKYEGGSTVTLDSGFGRGEERNVFRRMKFAAKSIIMRKNRR